jgi:hypothetical protein
MFLVLAITAAFFAGCYAVYRWRRQVVTTSLSTEDLILPDPPSGARIVGRSPALDLPYGRHKRFGKRTEPPVRYRAISLTPRMLERMNHERRRRGAPPLNREGIKAAVATASTEYVTHGNRQPGTSSDWLTYLILYEVLFDDHKSTYCTGTGGFTVDPNQPFNGAGGEFAGAGASGDWTAAPVTASIAATIVQPESFAPIPMGDQVGDGGGKYSAGDFVGGYGGGGYPQSQPSDPSSSGPGPSYSAPDPSPSSSSSDSSSSSSSSSDSRSSSSSSYDSGSSSSFDSGGSSGGGGGDGS